MPTSPKAFIYLSLGFLMVAVIVYTFIDPTTCESGCGSLMGPVFTFLYSAVGPWGPRVLLILAAVFFFWASLSTRE